MLKRAKLSYRNYRGNAYERIPYIYGWVPLPRSGDIPWRGKAFRAGVVNRCKARLKKLERDGVLEDRIWALRSHMSAMAWALDRYEKRDSPFSQEQWWDFVTEFCGLELAVRQLERVMPWDFHKEAA
jgi:hypothetical protein